ncbi:MAG: tetratricopeptide repeat protein [Bacteroidales bacterium]|nr:tetratricopeptide repeat protein [Bacteroidales bacterium]
MRKLKYLFSALFILASLGLSAQKMERKSVRQGNKLYENKKYTEAEISYRKALAIDPKSKEGSYNLGNALYKQEKGKDALEQYQLSLSQESNPMNKAFIQHNVGNTFMQAKDYGKAVDSYKNSLRLNPNDNETRYNLAMAQALLKKQQQDQKKDKNKDKNKDQKQDQQQKQQQQQQDDQQKKQNKQKQEQQKQAQEQVSKEKAKQLLDALSQDEKDTQEKVKKLQMQQSKAKKAEKDW